MASITRKLLPLHGYSVPVADWETLQRLERIAFSLTPSDWPDSMAHRKATRAAMEALEHMRISLRRKAD